MLLRHGIKIMSSEPQNYETPNVKLAETIFTRFWLLTNVYIAIKIYTIVSRERKVLVSHPKS